MANLMGKTVDKANAYEVWERGDWTWYIRKFYKSRANTVNDPWGRVLCTVKSPMSIDSGDVGDVYYRDIADQAVLVSTNYPEV